MSIALARPEEADRLPPRDPSRWTGLSLRPLHLTFGAEVEGLDLAAPLGDAALEAVRAALSRHLLLVFRQQELTPARQVELTASLGPVALHPLRGLALDALPEILVERPDADDRDQHWHADQAWAEAPNRFSAVAAAELDSNSWTSEFTSLVAAYDRLDPWLRDHIEFLEVEHDHPRRQAAGAAVVRHPLVRLDPASGRRSLLLDSGSARRVIGVPAAESPALLERLEQVATHPAAVLRHQWREGDLLLWDNLSVLHRVRDFAGGHLHRTMVRGTAPIGPGAVTTPWVSAG